MFNKTIITVTAAVALGCMPVATNALAADHPGSGHGGGGHALSSHAMGDTPRADMLVAVMGHDTEVGITGVRDRSTTPAMATMATAAQVSAFPMSVV